MPGLRIIKINEKEIISFEALLDKFINETNSLLGDNACTISVINNKEKNKVFQMNTMFILCFNSLKEKYYQSLNYKTTHQANAFLHHLLHIFISTCISLKPQLISFVNSPKEANQFANLNFLMKSFINSNQISNWIQQSVEIINFCLDSKKNFQNFKIVFLDTVKPKTSSPKNIFDSLLSYRGVNLVENNIEIYFDLHSSESLKTELSSNYCLYFLIFTDPVVPMHLDYINYKIFQYTQKKNMNQVSYVEIKADHLRIYSMFKQFYYKITSTEIIQLLKTRLIKNGIPKAISILFEIIAKSIDLLNQNYLSLLEDDLNQKSEKKSLINMSFNFEKDKQNTLYYNQENALSIEINIQLFGEYKGSNNQYLEIEEGGYNYRQDQIYELTSQLTVDKSLMLTNLREYCLKIFQVVLRSVGKDKDKVNLLNNVDTLVELSVENINIRNLKNIKYRIMVMIEHIFNTFAQIFFSINTEVVDMSKFDDVKLKSLHKVWDMRNKEINVFLYMFLTEFFSDFFSFIKLNIKNEHVKGDKIISVDKDGLCINFYIQNNPKIKLKEIIKILLEKILKKVNLTTTKKNYIFQIPKKKQEVVTEEINKKKANLENAKISSASKIILLLYKFYLQRIESKMIIDDPSTSPKKQMIRVLKKTYSNMYDPSNKSSKSLNKYKSPSKKRQNVDKMITKTKMQSFERSNRTSPYRANNRRQIELPTGFSDGKNKMPLKVSKSKLKNYSKSNKKKINLVDFGSPNKKRMLKSTSISRKKIMGLEEEKFRQIGVHQLSDLSSFSMDLYTLKIEKDFFFTLQSKLNLVANEKKMKLNELIEILDKEINLKIKMNLENYKTSVSNYLESEVKNSKVKRRIISRFAKDICSKLFVVQSKIIDLIEKQKKQKIVSSSSIDESNINQNTSRFKNNDNYSKKFNRNKLFEQRQNRKKEKGILSKTIKENKKLDCFSEYLLFVTPDFLQILLEMFSEFIKIEANILLKKNFVSITKTNLIDSFKLSKKVISKKIEDTNLNIVKIYQNFCILNIKNKAKFKKDKHVLLADENILKEFVLKNLFLPDEDNINDNMSEASSLNKLNKNKEKINTFFKNFNQKDTLRISSGKEIEIQLSLFALFKYKSASDEKDNIELSFGKNLILLINKSPKRKVYQIQC